MRYSKGDILFDYKTRFVYRYTGTENIMYSIIATDRERKIFQKTGRNSMTFAEFKHISPETDLRRKHRVYGIVQIDENLFLQARKLSKNFSFPLNYEVLLNIIVDDYFHKVIKNARSKPQEKKKETIITELKKLISLIENI